MDDKSSFTVERILRAEAPIRAAMKADTMLENGDMDGVATWRRVVKAGEEMLDTRPPPRQRQH